MDVGFRVRARGRWLVLTLYGDVSGDPRTAIPAIDDMLRDAVVAGHGLLVVDLGGLRSLDPVGVRALVRAGRRAAALDGQLRLVPPAGGTARALAAEQLPTYVDVLSACAAPLPGPRTAIA